VKDKGIAKKEWKYLTQRKNIKKIEVLQDMYIKNQDPACEPKRRDFQRSIT